MEAAFIVLIYVISVIGIGEIVKRAGVTSHITIIRSSPIDSLRGWLATAVACHHTIITYIWKTEGSWKDSESSVISNMGSIPVSMFFMITAFLFFGKIYNKEPTWRDILLSRLTRILPLYYTMVSVVVAFSIATTGFIINSTKGLAIDVSKWMLFIGAPINGLSDSRNMLAGVQWTLIYESIFYLSLPLIAIFASKRKSLIATAFSLITVTPICIAGYVKGIIRPELFSLFAIGFIPVIIKAKSPYMHNAMQTKLAAAASLIIIFAAFTFTEKYSLLQIALVGISFVPIALGNELFGILRPEGSKSLGEISYSIYLIHGAVLYAMFSIANITSFNLGIYTFSVYIPIVLLITSTISILTYKYIESPWISISKRYSRGYGSTCISQNLVRNE
ncbi:acyltransferase [Pseudomonas aeruginosa]|nr:acyltransferase [Pseudomonas aeruginosa]ELH7228233.1 acyltransferase [Pseudomonas aeruginosa]ELT7042390.1 acyltransferase [Pseudomonas aeruginosa]